jgi:deazaflavin-dependent oxidoreductase (nitroreductase family)
MTQRLTIHLTATGRRSGASRTVTLYAFTDGKGLVVVGSRGGAARHPAWVHNLRAEPHAIVARGRAREVTGAEERSRLWQLVTEAFPLYASYQRRTERTIPLFVLEPATEAT